MTKKIRLGVQLFTLRDETKDPDNLRDVFSFVKSTGAETVELSAMPDVPAKLIADLTKEMNLSVASTHIPYSRLQKDWDSVVADHLIYKSPTIGIPMPPPECFFSLSALLKFTASVNRMQEEAAKAGLYMHYHNHHMEFKKKFGSKRIIDIMYEEFAPEVTFCLDIFWAKYAKADIEKSIDMLGTRLTQIHMKGYQKRLFFPKMCSPAEGIIDYPKCLFQAEKYGTDAALIEIDTIANPRAAINSGMDFLIENYAKK
ncbi:MAG: sugar phosphate isomerase/epimerase [Clostridia bacterium]